MALSMDEQRILSEIASQLSENDPRLARHLSTFGLARRRRRIKLLVIVGIVLAFALTVAVAAVVVIAGS
ncbi:MAG: hypothetical protein JWO67_2959 [Streptosporangiaceae bacterium]|jgi:hypothetical protein|nr:hypothetical protein [Streptosporangiaceae bacterium]